MSIFQILKGLVTSKQFTRFLWTTFDSFLAYLVVYFTQIDLLWILPIVAFFQLITKEVMNRVVKK
jgi:hypothetical protein